MRSSKYTEHFDLANPVTKVDDIPIMKCTVKQSIA